MWSVDSFAYNVINDSCKNYWPKGRYEEKKYARSEITVIVDFSSVFDSQVIRAIARGE